MSATMPATTARPAPIAPGLVYVSPEMLGCSRVRSGERFRFKDPRGRWIRDPDEIARIRALAIPPAYTEVWICPLPNGHLQAVGLDARGRRQYRYHAQWRRMQDEAKFDRLEAFGHALPRIRARVRRDLKAMRPGAAPTRAAVLAAVVRLLDTTYLRVGNEEYASANGSFGLTTLRSRHARVRGGRLRLRFKGKSGIEHEAEVEDARVARVVRRCQELPGQALFQYEDEAGARHAIGSGDVNDYLREASGGDFTAKDFRTWHGTVQALELTRLACERAAAQDDAARWGAREIVGAVARQLGNTPAVCRKAYIHPEVLALGSRLDDAPQALAKAWRRSTGGRRGQLAAEARLLAFMRACRGGRLTGARSARSAAAPAASSRGRG